MAPSHDPTAVSCWNSLRALEWWLHQKTRDPQPRGSQPHRHVSDMRTLTHALAQLLLTAELADRAQPSAMRTPSATRSSPPSRHPMPVEETRQA
jgi:hypothetical protein